MVHDLWFMVCYLWFMVLPVMTATPLLADTFKFVVFMVERKRCIFSVECVVCMVERKVCVSRVEC